VYDGLLIQRLTLNKKKKRKAGNWAGEKKEERDDEESKSGIKAENMTGASMRDTTTCDC